MLMFGSVLAGGTEVSSRQTPGADRNNLSPLDKLDPNHAFDGWEYVLYIMTASFLIEGRFCLTLAWTVLTGHKIEAYKLFRVIRITPRFYTALASFPLADGVE